MSVHHLYFLRMEEPSRIYSAPPPIVQRLAALVSRRITGVKKYLHWTALPLGLMLIAAPHLSIPLFLLSRLGGMFFLGYTGVGVVKKTRSIKRRLVYQFTGRTSWARTKKPIERTTDSPNLGGPNLSAPGAASPTPTHEQPSPVSQQQAAEAPSSTATSPPAGAMPTQQPPVTSPGQVSTRERADSPMVHTSDGHYATNSTEQKTPLHWTPASRAGQSLAQSAESLAKKKVFDTPSHPTQRAPQVVSGPASEGQTGAGFYRDVLKMVATVKQPALAQMVAKTALERGGAPSDPASLSFQRVLAEIASGPANMQHAQRSARQLLAAHADGPAAAGGPARSKSQAAVAGVQTRTVSAPARSGESLGGL